MQTDKNKVQSGGERCSEEHQLFEEVENSTLYPFPQEGLSLKCFVLVHIIRLQCFGKLDFAAVEYQNCIEDCKSIATQMGTFSNHVEKDRNSSEHCMWCVAQVSSWHCWIMLKSSQSESLAKGERKKERKKIAINCPFFSQLKFVLILSSKHCRYSDLQPFMAREERVTGLAHVLNEYRDKLLARFAGVKVIEQGTTSSMLVCVFLSISGISGWQDFGSNNI